MAKYEEFHHNNNKIPYFWLYTEKLDLKLVQVKVKTTKNYLQKKKNPYIFTLACFLSSASFMKVIKRLLHHFQSLLMFSYLSVFYINYISWCVCIRGKAEQIISKLLLYFIFCRKILGSIAYCQLYSGTGTAIRFRRWTLAGPFLIWLNRFREYYLHCLTWFAGRDAPSRWSGWLKKKIPKYCLNLKHKNTLS